MYENTVRLLEMKNTTPLSTAIYARVSTSDQHCENQLREVRDYITRHGWQLAGEYVDAGFSGAKASRPALDRLMADAAKRKFDCVAVWKLDRFGRSVLHLNQQLDTLTRHGIRFIATSQGIDTDKSNPAASFMLQILAAVAMFERELIRERTLCGIRAARAAGKNVGRPKRVFRRDDVIRLRDQEGLSWRAIAAKLKLPVMTVVDAYKTFQSEKGCTETVPSQKPSPALKTRTRKRAS
jgi:DNA invertase Pin-like site-specific DNA recombinase